MKKILFLILFIPFFVLAKDDVKKFEVYCVSLQRITEVLSRHEEQPMLTLVSHRQIDGQKVEIYSVLFMNPKTNTFTLTEKITDDYYCVISVGDNMKPYKEIR